MNKLILLFLIGFHFQLFSQNQSRISLENTIRDIDGNVYKTVKIGKQIWMAEDLYVTKFNDGTAIRKLNVNSYEEEYESNFDKYEGLHKLQTPILITPINSKRTIYNWYVVHSNRNVCPTGWHIPIPEEWDALESYVESTLTNDKEEIGAKLKSEMGYNGFGEGTDEFGFNALPINSSGVAWWAISNNGNNVMSPGIAVEDDSWAYGIINKTTFDPLSIRCLKD